MRDVGGGKEQLDVTHVIYANEINVKYADQGVASLHIHVASRPCT